MKNNLVYLLIVNFFVIILLVWIGNTRIHDFKSYHAAIAQESAQSAANAIEGFIAEKKRQVNLFSINHLELIKQFANNGQNEHIYTQLQSLVASYFPGYFTFNVVDQSGELVRDDFDGYIGVMCMTDLIRFNRNGRQMPRVHPNEYSYHFDVLAPLDIDRRKKILFVSFHADMIGVLLESARTSGHQLLLINPDASNLIEVTKDGSRIKWDRADYRLSKEELDRVISTKSVPNSVWSVVDLHHLQLFEDFIYTVLKQSLLIFVIFVFISLVMYKRIKREEKLRKQADKYKDEFLSVVSHELRTPITSIKGALGLVNNSVVGEINPEVEEMISIALNNSERLAVLIDDLLDSQKIESGSMEFGFHEHELVTLTRQAVRDNQGYADRFNVKFKFQSNVEAVIVNVDEVRIGQVLANLLSNAIKYGALNDEVIITINVTDNDVRVSVTDHGEGIPLFFTNRVFTKFAQSDASTTRKVSGTGLGLSISKQIIEKHGGKIGFDSLVGKGSTFYFDLPVLHVTLSQNSLQTDHDGTIATQNN